jgi:hypothetical protein
MNKEEDFLTVDNPIPGQNFVCLSFVSPEKTLANKNTYFIHNFLKSKSIEYKLSLSELTEEYDNYFYNNSDKLEKEFYENNDFRTSVRGLKVRGTYDTRREAEVRAKVLQRQDKNFHVFVGQVGYWLPWDPEADDIEDQEYTENSLNKLVKKYQDNKKKKDIYFEKQKEDSLKQINKTNEDNKKKIEENELENLEKNFENMSNIMESDDTWLKNKEKNLEKENGDIKLDSIKETNETDKSEYIDLDT